MNEFERRWKLAASAARPLHEPAPEKAPYGFSTQVLARWQKAEASTASAWLSWATRLCAGLAVVVVVLSSVAVWSHEPSENWQPGLEQTIDELFWPL